MFYRVITRENGHKMVKKVTFYRVITREKGSKMIQMVTSIGQLQGKTYQN